MKVTANKKGLVALVLTLMLSLSLAACGGNNEYDTFLDDYEKFVVEIEDIVKKGEAPTQEKQESLSKMVQDFAAKGQAAAGKGNPSAAQVERANKLSERLTGAMQKMVQLQLQNMPTE